MSIDVSSTWKNLFPSACPCIIVPLLPVSQTVLLCMAAELRFADENAVDNFVATVVPAMSITGPSVSIAQ